MSRTLSLLIAACFLGLSAVAVCEEENLVALEFQVFRVSGSLSGETWLDEEIWMKGNTPDLDTLRNLTAFTGAKFLIGEQTLDCSGETWTLEGTEVLSSGETDVDTENLRVLSAPRIAIKDGESASFEIESDQAIEYFQPREDGAYELKQLQQQTGFELTTAVEVEDHDTIRLSDLTLTLRSVEERQPLAGVRLNVGKPVISTRESVVSMTVRDGRNYGLLFQSEDGRGVLIIRLRAEAHKEQEQ